jgi:hypothetical protein
MLSYERTVVDALLSTDDGRIRWEVTDFTGTSLAAMPPHLRFGIAAISVVLGGYDALRRLIGLRRTPAALVTWLDEHPIGLVRQWVRVLRSLVLFAEHEKLEAAAQA